MKKIAVIMIFFVSVAAQAELFHKKDPAVMKQVQYRKVMAVEEMNILEKYIQCLNNADSIQKMDKCTKTREDSTRKLFRQSGEIKKEVGQKTKS